MKQIVLKKVFIASLTVFVFSIMIYSCKKEKNNGVTNISAHNENKSHHSGMNCMECHKNGGDGTGWFTVAGTVYNNDGTTVFPNTVVKLYTDKNGGGTLKYTINGDNLGNFFTTEQVDFGNGLYPAVEGTQGTQFMSFSIKTGECYSCHGNSTDVIWTK